MMRPLVTFRLREVFRRARQRQQFSVSEHALVAMRLQPNHRNTEPSDRRRRPRVKRFPNVHSRSTPPSTAELPAYLVYPCERGRELGWVNVLLRDLSLVSGDVAVGALLRSRSRRQFRERTPRMQCGKLMHMRSKLLAQKRMYMRAAAVIANNARRRRLWKCPTALCGQCAVVGTTARTQGSTEPLTFMRNKPYGEISAATIS